MTKRLFIAIKASNALQNNVSQWRKKYQNFLPVRWIQIRNLHLTLVPPWSEKNLEGVRSCLRSLDINLAPFTVQFIKVSLGPTSKRPRLVWAIGKESNELVYLKKLLEKAFGKKTDERPFRPHMSLARFKPKDFSKFRTKRINEDIFWEQKVDSFALFESFLLNRGSEYEVLEKVILK